MKYLLFILIFFIASCSPPEPGTDEWFEEKYNELIEADPSVEPTLTLEEFIDIFKEAAISKEIEASDELLIKKHLISYWLMDDSFLPPIDGSVDVSPVYIKVLKQCAANFSAMYANMQAGLSFGKTITGLDDVEEIKRLSKEYRNHSLYFATRAEELLLKEEKDVDMVRSSLDSELISIQAEIFEIVSDEKFIDLLEGNAEICLLVRDTNPNNKDYKFE